MNNVELMGRLTADPELRQTPQGVSVVRFTIAVNRRFAKEGSQQADFINCIAWRQTGEFIARYFRKGSMIAVDGSIQTRSWDGQDGRKQYATEVVVENSYFTGGKPEASQTPQADSYAKQGYGTSPHSQTGYSSQPYSQYQTSLNHDGSVNQNPKSAQYGNTTVNTLEFTELDANDDDLPF